MTLVLKARLIYDNISTLGGRNIKFFRLNDRIQASQLRVIDEQGNLLGLLSKSEALLKAREMGLDLVEVAPNATPPVARIVDFEKFRYAENKKEQAAKKHAKGVGQKEIWLSPRIDTHDLEVRLKRAAEFIEKGNKVKLTVKFKGREMAHPEIGHKVVKDSLAYFGETVTVERESKFEGRNLTTIITGAK